MKPNIRTNPQASPVILKKDGSNYASWKVMMKLHMVDQGLYTHPCGHGKVNKGCDTRAKMVLLMSLESDTLQKLCSSEDIDNMDSQEVWEILEILYSFGP